jgi:hypothetical protein
MVDIIPEKSLNNILGATQINQYPTTIARIKKTHFWLYITLILYIPANRNKQPKRNKEM